MFGRRSQRDFEDEITSHLQLEIDRLKAQGMSDADAERAARRNFGNVGVAEDRFYHANPLASMQDVLRDLGHAWRSLRRTPAFFVTAVGTLALAIGATAGMFSVVNTVLLEPLPYPNSDRLVVLRGTAPGSDLPEQFGIGNDFYFHYKENSKLIDGIFGFGNGTSTLRTDDRVERIGMVWPMNDMYATLGVRPQLGRLPRAEDRDDAILISDRLWSTWFGRDPNILGKWYFVSDSMKQVIGVMPPEFQFPDEQAMLWVSGEPRLEDVQPGSFGMPVVARLKEGVTHEQLAAELTRISKGLPDRFGGPPAYARIIEKHSAVVVPVLDVFVGPTAKTSLWVLLGAVAVVLLIACANVANLFMVRAESRRRDLTVRRAIGASRAQLMRFQLAEALVVALVAGVLAVVLSTLTLPLFVRAAPEGLARLQQVGGLDLSTLAVAFVLVIFAALACGGFPALRASSPDLAGLREGGRGSTGQRQWGRDLLVVGQTALALVLLIGAALLVQSFKRLSTVNPGYDTKDLYTFQFAPERSWRTGPEWAHLHLDFMNRLRALPGVTTVGVVNNIPLDEGTNSWRFVTEGQSPDGGGTLLDVNFTAGDYFQAMGIDLLQGRTHTDAEAVSANASVVVSRSAAAKLWPNQDPIGRQLRRINPNPAFAQPFTVIGVVDDVKQDDWRESGEAGVYFTLTGPTLDIWGMGSPAYVVKTPRAEFIKDEVRRLVREVAPEAPVYREYTMEFLAKRYMTQLSFTMLTLGVVSALALILGAVGLYGVLSYVVAQRTREIGVRMALGATAGAVRRQVVSQGTRVVLIGVTIGIAGALASTRFLGALLFGVKAVDPLVFAAMAALMIAMGVLASYMPARRASSVDPIEALRSD